MYQVTNLISFFFPRCCGARYLLESRWGVLLRRRREAMGRGDQQQCQHHVAQSTGRSADPRGPWFIVRGDGTYSFSR